MNSSKILFDKDDQKLFDSYKWRISTQGYLVAYKRGSGRKHYSIIAFHREVLNANKNQQIDHINGNRLDNRKENLRLCNNAENNRNKLKSKKGSSKYKGVCWHKASKKWKASITVNYKSIHLGYFSIEKDAAKAYNEAAINFFKEFALLNKLGE